MEKLKTVFLYEGPHAVHAAWARSIGAKFIPNIGAGPKMGSGWSSRIAKAFLMPFMLRKIPKDTNVLLIEGGLGFIVGFFFKKIRKGKIVMIVSDPLFYELKQKPLLAKIGYFMIKDFDSFVPTSKLMANLIPFENKKIVYPFIEVKRFGRIKANIGCKNIIYTGILNRQKGVDKVVRVFLQIQKVIPEAKLFLVGKGPLKEEIDNIGNKMIVLPGFTKNPENYIKECSLYINLSRLDPFGVGVVEAMAAGLVPIISENVGARDLLEKIDKKLVVKNIEEAKKRIAELFKNKKKLIRLSKKAKEIGKKQNKEKNIKNFKKAFYSFVK